jgi:TPP-dependent 2-oxoacid decarboxylase
MSRNITEFLNSKSESVKLKAEKIELALLDDIKKEYASIMSMVKKSEEAISKAKTSAVMGDSMINDFNSEVDKLEKLAKELGVSVKDINIGKLSSDIKEASKLFNSIIKV